MFNSKKQASQDNNSNKGKQKIEMEIKTMKGDLKNLPSQKESFFAKDNSEKKTRTKKS